MDVVGLRPTDCIQRSLILENSGRGWLKTHHKYLLSNKIIVRRVRFMFSVWDRYMIKLHLIFSFFLHIDL